jgi:hypothetical protein
MQYLNYHVCIHSFYIQSANHFSSHLFASFSSRSLFTRRTCINDKWIQISWLHIYNYFLHVCVVCSFFHAKFCFNGKRKMNKTFNFKLPASPFGPGWPGGPIHQFQIRISVNYNEKIKLLITHLAVLEALRLFQLGIDHYWVLL